MKTRLILATSIISLVAATQNVNSLGVGENNECCNSKPKPVIQSKAESNTNNKEMFNVRKIVGNALRTAGDFIRTIESDDSPISNAKVAANNVIRQFVGNKSPFSITPQIWQGFGNALRFLGEKVRGSAPTLTPERALIDEMKLNRSANAEQVQKALSDAAAKLVNSGEEDVSGVYRKTVTTLQKRGYDVKGANEAFVRGLTKALFVKGYSKEDTERLVNSFADRGYSTVKKINIHEVVSNEYDSQELLKKTNAIRSKTLQVK